MQTTTIQHEVTTENYFDTADGLYWFCVHYHAGQDSVLYRVQCQADFHPGPLATGPDGEEAEMVYNDLAALAEENYTAAEDEAERLLAEIQKNYDLARD
jgi:hypothetical protein